jgi:hypothetical protein
MVIPADLKIGYEFTVLSRGEACENTQKTRLSIKTERYLVPVQLERLEVRHAGNKQDSSTGRRRYHHHALSRKASGPWILKRSPRIS